LTSFRLRSFALGSAESSLKQEKALLDEVQFERPRTGATGLTTFCSKDAMA
jgi:hypothetical protein